LVKNGEITLKRVVFLTILILAIINGVQGAGRPDTLLKINPKGAMWRSIFIPGWGQLYNRKPLKGILLFGAESYFIYNFIHYNRIYGYVKTTKETLGIDAWISLTEEQKKAQILAITDHELSLNSWRPREKRNKYGWWCVGTYIFCLMDAIVDAHLINFPPDAVELSAEPTMLKLTINIGL